jgi:hypothetical protein
MITEKVPEQIKVKEILNKIAQENLKQTTSISPNKLETQLP